MVFYYIEDEKGRKATKKAIPEEVRRKYQEMIDKQYEQALEQRKKMEEQERARATQYDEEDGAQEDSKGAKKAKDVEPPKDLGILNGEETKQYTKMRRKIYAILKWERSQKRLSEWLDGLKKRSIIDVKI